MHLTDQFYRYEGGIFEQSVLFTGLSHEVSVVGWGQEEGVEFWIVRNSWGTQWGEDGFARVRMHERNLGIETSCYWAVVE